MPVVESPRQELTLRDRLSRLTFVQACKLLGENGSRLIQEGGKVEIDIQDDVFLGNDLFRLKLPDAVVTLTTMAEAPGRLRWNCNQCRELCWHVGAAFSLILEDKMALGLAAPPPEKVPAESLSEEELIAQAIEERRERAREERMSIRSQQPAVLWTDYTVTNSVSGRTYRVALRGWQPGESYCACPDFRKNTLGVCKHILAVQNRVRPKFPKEVRDRPYRQQDIAVHLRYGRELELRMLLPERIDAEVQQAVRPVADRPIASGRQLVDVIARLQSLGHAVTVYPDAEEYLQRLLHQERIAVKVAAIRADPKAHPLRKELLKTELLPYQLDGIAFAVGAGRAILADDMGLGKTIQGIGVAEMLAREAGARKVLVICPASLKSQWRNEIHRFSQRDCQLVLGGAADRARQYDNECFFTICNYEQVLRDILAIEQIHWDLIILDEGQRIKNWEAKTTRVVKGLRSTFALVLSGTPLENRIDDLFSVVEFIDDRRLGPAFRFYNRHRVVDEKGRVLGYKNLADLRKSLAPILLRRTRKSVMQDLPPRSTEIVRIPPTMQQADLHSAQMKVVSSIVRKQWLTEMDLLRLRKALLMARMAANSTLLVDKKPPGYSTKLEQLRELLEGLLAEEDRKLLIFSEWTSMLDLIEPLLGGGRGHYVRLDGGVPQRKRQEIVNAFQRHDDCRVFLTTNAGATGLNLQAANTVVNVDLPWNPAILEQRIARAHRMGQKRNVQVYILVTEETIEEGLLGTLSAKHELAQAALDPDSDIDKVDLVSGVEELRRRLEVLLGARPEAPLDESQRMRREAEAQAERLARQEKVAAAGGQLLGAAFRFLGELVPARPQTPESQQLAELIQRQLEGCMEKDDRGGMKLTVALPDNTAVAALANSLAGILSLRA